MIHHPLVVNGSKDPVSMAKYVLFLFLSCKSTNVLIILTFEFLFD